MKVGIVTTSKYHLFALARALQDEGHLGRIVSGYPKYKLESEGIDPEHLITWPYWTVPYFAMLRLNLGATRAAKQMEWNSNVLIDEFAVEHMEGMDVVVAAGGSGLQCGLSVQARGGKYICDRGAAHIAAQFEILSREFEKLGLEGPCIEQRRIDRELEEYEAADAIFVPSSITKQTFVSQGVSADKVHVLNLGADLALFKPGAERATDKLEVLFAGQLSVQKGLHILFDAVKSLGADKVRIRLAGLQVAETPTLMERANGLEVEMLGSLSPTDLSAAMARAHVLVLPSLQDGYGMVVPQAMACGTPAIVSDAAGASEFVEPEATGLVFPSGDTEAFKACLERFLADPTLSEQMGQKGIEAVKRLGGWSSYASQSVQAIRDIVGYDGPE